MSMNRILYQRSPASGVWPTVLSLHLSFPRHARVPEKEQLAVSNPQHAGTGWRNQACRTSSIMSITRSLPEEPVFQ
jgi:hypothetical protein